VGVVGPVAGAVGLVVGNAILVQGEAPTTPDGAFNPVIFRPVVGGVIAVVVLSTASQFVPRTAEMFAWLMLVGSALVRIDPKTPSPVESLLAWYSATPPANGPTVQPKR
jgi:hypothetical protein